MSKKEIEMKNDGKDADRFVSMLKTVVTVPKKDIEKYEKKQKKKAKKS